MFTLEIFRGAQNGWRPVSAASSLIDRATAERRLSLYKKVRGADFLYRIVCC